MRRDFEFLGCKFQNGGKRSRFRNAKPAIKLKNEKKFMKIERISLRNILRILYEFTHTLKGSLGSEVSVTLKETFPPDAIFLNYYFSFSDINQGFFWLSMEEEII